MANAKMTALAKINPLIDGRDTSNVESVLKLLSFLIVDAANESITLNFDQAFGLVLVLDTCQAALKAMRDAGEVSA